MERPQASSRPPRPDAGSNRTSHPNGKRVLIAEPDRTLGELYRTTLESDGWTVELADNAQSAWSLVLASPPDLLILNALPDAVSFMQRLRDHEPSKTLGVVALTNAGGDGDMEAAKQFGLLAVLTKNRMMREKLSATLSALVDRDRP